MNAHRLFATAVCVASLSIYSGTLYALDSARDEPASMRLASDERSFMKEAAASGVYQLATSKVAVNQARSPEVKKLAAKFAQDYAEVNSQLQKLAAAKS